MAPSTFDGVVTSGLRDLCFQVGAYGDSTSCLMVDTSLDFSTYSVDFSNVETSATAIADTDLMLEALAQKRSEFGVIMNRLDSIVSSNTVTSQNLTSALSTIMDADVSEETIKYIKHNILTQSTATLLAQTGSVNSNTIMTLISGL